MYQILISSVAALGLVGCVAVHADLPEEFLGSIHTQADYTDMCVHAGQPYSEGSTVCLDGRRLRCHDEEWVSDGNC